MADKLLIDPTLQQCTYWKRSWMPLNARESECKVENLFKWNNVSHVTLLCRCCRYVATRPLWEFKLENFNIEMAYIGEWWSPFISSETWAIRNNNIINLSFSSRSGRTRLGEQTQDMLLVLRSSWFIVLHPQIWAHFFARTPIRYWYSLSLWIRFFPLAGWGGPQLANPFNGVTK